MARSPLRLRKASSTLTSWEEVQAPQARRIVVGEISAQQVAAFTPPGRAQFLVARRYLAANRSSWRGV
jgi:hypothetical protein